MSLRENLVAMGMNLPADFDFDLDAWASKLKEKPMTKTAALVGASSVAFYLMERGRNPKVNDVFDAMVYCSTCLSVGYGDIFAKTPLGKVLGSALMTIGPAVAAGTLEGKKAEVDETQEEILRVLREILDRLNREGATARRENEEVG